jgi:hypothetical protein
MVLRWTVDREVGLIVLPPLRIGAVKPKPRTAKRSTGIIEDSAHDGTGMNILGGLIEDRPALGEHRLAKIKDGLLALHHNLRVVLNPSILIPWIVGLFSHWEHCLVNRLNQEFVLGAFKFAGELPSVIGFVFGNGLHVSFLFRVMSPAFLRRASASK